MGTEFPTARSLREDDVLDNDQGVVLAFSKRGDRGFCSVHFAIVCVSSQILTTSSYEESEPVRAVLESSVS